MHLTVVFDSRNSCAMFRFGYKGIAIDTRSLLQKDTLLELLMKKKNTVRSTKLNRHDA
jgi:hypothetical protein